LILWIHAKLLKINFDKIKKNGIEIIVKDLSKLVNTIMEK